MLVFFSTFSSQNLKYPTLMHWLASWVNPTSKTHIPCLPTTSQVSPVQFSLDSVALNFRPIWCHRPSLKHCALHECLRHPSTDVPANSDTVGTRQKCHCWQTVSYCVTIAKHIYYKKVHLGLTKSVTIAILCHYRCVVTMDTHICITSGPGILSSILI